MNADQLALLEIIRQSPNSIAFTELVARARKKQLFLDSAADVDSVKPDAYRKKIERVLNALLNQSTPYIPLEKTGTKPVFYSLPKDYQLPPTELDVTLAMVLNLSQQMVDNLLPTQQKQQLEDYYRLSEQLFKERHAMKRYEEFTKKVAFHPEGYGNRLVQKANAIVDSAVLTSLADALFHNQQVRFSYELRYAEMDSDYQVSPLGMVVRGQVIYLVANVADEKSDKIRHFHTGRIYNLERLDEQAQVPSAWSLPEYLEQGAFEQNQGNILPEQTVELWIDSHMKALFMERVPNAIVHEDEDGQVTVTFSARLYPEFIWWLLGFGQQVVALSPPELVERMKQEVEAMWGYYYEP